MFFFLYFFKLPSKSIISLLFGELSNIDYFFTFLGIDSQPCLPHISLYHPCLYPHLSLPPHTPYTSPHTSSPPHLSLPSPTPCYSPHLPPHPNTLPHAYPVDSPTSSPTSQYTFLHLSAHFPFTPTHFFTPPTPPLTLPTPQHIFPLFPLHFPLKIVYYNCLQQELCINKSASILSRLSQA